MLKAFKVSSNAYYRWIRQGGFKKPCKKLRYMIQMIFNEHKGIYGAPKLQKVLEKRGLYYSVSWISKLMKTMNLRSKVVKKYVVTTDSKHPFKINDNLLDRKFHTDQTSKVWVSDISYIKVGLHWNYLTTIIDLADRSVVAWNISDNMEAENTVIETWNKAVKNRTPKQELIFHSDRGSQYACKEFRKVLFKNPSIKQSMSRKGNCWDNAVAESFFKSIKYEWILHYNFQSIDQVKIAVEQYVNWYNTKRIHASIDYMTPLEKYAQLNNILIQNVA